jgi:hypothetical protein
MQGGEMSTRTPDPKRWPAWLWLAALVFPPPGVWLMALQKGPLQGLISHPWLALTLVLGYEVLVLLGGLIHNIWQRLEGSWLDAASREIDAGMRRLLARYGGYYREYFQYEHRHLDVRGLTTQGTYTLELEQVFVDLRIEATAPHEASHDPLRRLPETLQEGSHALWEYLESPLLRDLHLVILGAPGSGKTTLLRHIGVSLASTIHRRRTRFPARLPVLLFLREHSKAIEQSLDYALADAVRAETRKWQQGSAGKRMPPGWIERHLEKGRCLVLLDGLDEVADGQIRQMVVTWIQRQMGAYHHNRFLVTSRPRGYRTNPLDNVAILEVQPFTPPQVRQFVTHWYRANRRKSAGRDDPGVRMMATREADDLLHRLAQTPSLDDLTVNPLLLTMIATVHCYRGSLPGTRVALYQEICEVFLGKRQEAHAILQDMRADQRQVVLQSLAYRMMQEGIREISHTRVQEIIREPVLQISSTVTPQEFLHGIEHGSGLLLERENGVYTFAHLTFQEYLAMGFLREHHREHELVEHVDASWWHEVIRLYCAQNEASSIIEACLQKASASVEAFVLALECAEEARNMRPEVRAHLAMLVEHESDDQDPERGRIVTDALWRRREKAMVKVSEQCFVDTSFVTCIEYQRFLDDRWRAGHAHQPDQWQTRHFAPGQANDPIVGVRFSDVRAFCDWLTARDAGRWTYRLPRQGEPQLHLIHLPQGWDAPIGWWEETTPLPTIRVFGHERQREPSVLSRSSILLGLERSFVHRWAAEMRGRDMHRGSDLARVLDSVLALARVLDSDLALARNLYSDLARVLARASVLALDSDLALARNLYSDLARVLARASVLALDSDLARVLALDSDLDSVLVSVRNLASALARALARVRNLASDLDSASALASNLDRVRNLARDSGLASNSDLASDLAHISRSLCDLARMGLPTHAAWMTYAQLFAVVSVAWAYLHISIRNRSGKSQKTAWWRGLIRPRRPSVSSSDADVLTHNLAMAICLEHVAQRTRGEEAAYEGILLVKERTPEHTP